MRKRKRRGGRILRILGIALIIVALALLGGFAYMKLQEHREMQTQYKLQQMLSPQVPSAGDPGLTSSALRRWRRRASTGSPIALQSSMKSIRI